MSERRLYPSGGIHGQVAHSIGGRIVSGEIAEGTFLPREAELAEQFAVSRQAVREALKVLAAKGLVQSRRRTGTRVLPRASWNLFDPDVIAWHPAASFAPRLLNDIAELRILIEPAAAEYAATRGDRAAIEVIGATLSAMRENVDKADAFREADADFHAAMFAASGNEFIAHLADILGPLLRESFRLQDQVRGIDIAKIVLPRHEAVFAAIVARDGNEARRAMETLLTAASREVARISKPSGAG
ncbi:MAG TPA: FadR/GntR family transcriptional regulator [Bauldia sp.]|nr:FadR/GntR family transcriptional regulator [Bauldia sp.]